MTPNVFTFSIEGFGRDDLHLRGAISFSLTVRRQFFPSACAKGLTIRHRSDELVEFLVKDNPELSVVQRIVLAIKVCLASFLPGICFNEKDVVTQTHAAVRQEAKKALADTADGAIEGDYGRTRPGTNRAVGVYGASSSPERSRVFGSLQPIDGGRDMAFSDPLSWRRSQAATPRPTKLADSAGDKSGVCFGKPRIEFKDNGQLVPHRPIGKE